MLKNKNEKNYHNISSPFRYAGGKYYARKQILPIIPDHNVYVELFAGGGSIFFAKDKSDISILNDIDEDLVNVYKTIKDHHNDLIKRLENIDATKEIHDFYRNEYQPENSFDRAFQWYYLNRTSYSGIMHPSKRYWGYDARYSANPDKWPKIIHQSSDKLQGVKLTALDFEVCLERAINDFGDRQIFVFADPPYYATDQKDLYAKSFNQSDHERLAHVLEKLNSSFHFLLTYDDHEDIRNLYKWANVEERQWKYTIGRSDLQKIDTGKRKKGKELFIKNY